MVGWVCIALVHASLDCFAITIDTQSSLIDRNAELPGWRWQRRSIRESAAEGADSGAVRQRTAPSADQPGEPADRRNGEEAGRGDLGDAAFADRRCVRVAMAVVLGG